MPATPAPSPAGRPAPEAPTVSLRKPTDPPGAPAPASPPVSPVPSEPGPGPGAAEPAPEPGLRLTPLERMKLGTRRSAQTAQGWITAADLDGERAEATVRARRRRQADTARREHTAELRELRAGRRAAHREGDADRAAALAAAAEELTRMGPDIETPPEAEVSAPEVSRLRVKQRITRAGITAAGAYGGLHVIASMPGLLIVAIPAAIAAVWHAGRVREPADSGDKEADRPVTTQTEVQAGAEDVLALVTTGQDPVVPQPLADMAAATVPDGETPARVQGEDDLITALVRAGIITAAQREETRLAGIIQPDGPGWTATVELPRGVKASAAVGRIEDLASALRLKKTRIELTADRSEDGHEGRAVLWVANHDNPFGSGKRSSELIRADRWDFWGQGIPLGTDARGRRQTMHLLWSSLLIGGLMGYGKSYLARLVAAAAALDPTVRIIVVTGKTGPDWAPLRNVAQRWIAGATPEIIREVLTVMESTISEMQDRGSALDRLYETDPEKVPEGKITPELAADGMGPVLLVVDELQELLDGAALVRVPVDDDIDPESTKRAATRSAKDVLVEGFARYVRVTRFVGGMGVFITQRPDSTSVPTALRDVCSKRGSYRVKGITSSRMVLGDEPVAAGASPHLLTEASRGVVVLDQGDDTGHTTLKADVIDLPDFRAVCERGRQLRTDAGTLTGDAAEYGRQAAEAAARTQLLADCLTALDSTGTDRVRTDRLVELLAAHDPGRYSDLTKNQLQAMLRAAGAGTTRKLGRLDGMANPNGYLREQLADAHAKAGK